MLANQPVTASDAAKCSAVLAEPSSLVEFPTYSPNGGMGLIKGVLRRPPGDGPFPAVVILHRYFGIEPPDCYAEDQKRFAEHGWISLLVDSESGAAELRSGRPDTVNGYSHLDQGVDAWAAKSYLASRGDVETDRIAVLGHAFGGTGVLHAVSAKRMEPRLKVAPELDLTPFTVAIAWNPGCITHLSGLSSPLLVMIGENDELTPAHACRAMPVDGPAAGDYRLLVFPNVGHNFDSTWLPTYDKAATEKAYSETFQFLVESPN